MVQIKIALIFQNSALVSADGLLPALVSSVLDGFC